MKKNFIKITIILPMLLLTLIPLSVNAETYGDMTYTISNNEITITDCNTSVTEIVIPAKIANLPVTKIGREAFRDCTYLESITLPNSITEIENHAFYDCTSLPMITLPNNLKKIGEDAFCRCFNLFKVNIPPSVEELGPWAFGLCKSLYSIEIPASITKIGNHVFYGCTSLQSVKLNEGITEIPESMFENCESLSDINFPNTLLTIGDEAFSYCSSLRIVNLPPNLKSYGTAFRYSGIQQITLPESLTELGPFTDCYNLKSIKIPNGITSIDGFDFKRCTSLEKIEIPPSVKTIGGGQSDTFGYCTNLKEVHISDIKSWSSIIFDNPYANPLIYAKKLYLNGELIENLVIPDASTKISTYAFLNCTSLKSVTLPKSLLYIQTDAFKGCDNLQTVIYKGTKSQFEEVLIYSGNDYLQNSTKTYLDMTYLDIKTEKKDKDFIVTPSNIPNGSTIIFVCYNDNKMVYLDTFTYAGETTIPFTTTETYDKVKVMVWKNLKTLKPLCAAEEVPLN